MKKIDIKTPKEQLVRIVEEALGLYAYRETLDLTRIGTKEYQENYANYYKMSRMDENWRAAYFVYMQKQVGNSDITFEEIFKQISRVPHKWGDGSRTTNDASFASKMLATINPNYPILDSNVAKALGFNYHAKSMQYCIEIYNELTENVHSFLQTNGGAKCVKEFDRMCPNFTDISPVKKIDLYLWKMGK